MRRDVIAFGMALVLIAAPGYAQVRGLGGHPSAMATPPSVVAHYRFASPSSPTSPAEQQEMLDYRTQLQGQAQELQNLHTQHELGLFGCQDLTNTESELNRLNNTIQP